MAKKTSTSLGGALIAGEAAIGRAKQDLGAAKMFGTVGTTTAIQGVADGFTNYVNTKNQEYQGYAQKVLDEAGHLPSSEYDALYDNLMEGKKGYLLGGNKGRALSIRDLNMKAQDYAEYKDLRLNLSELSVGDNAEGEALSSYFSGTPEGQAYLDLLKDNSRLVQKVCPDDEPNCADKGRMGVMINGEWTSISTINQNIDKNLFDSGFKAGLGGLADKITEASLKVKEGENVEFPEGLIKQQLNTLLNDTSNRKSVAFDNMFGTTSFYQDLMQKIQSQDYASLGISQETIEALDTNGGNVTPEDAQQIAMELINNPQYANLANQEMINYFTGYLKQNWNNGVEGRTTTAPGYEFTKGGRYIKSTPGGGTGDGTGDGTSSDDFPSEIVLNTDEDEFSSSRYDNITVGDKKLSDMLNDAKSKEERDELISRYGNVQPLDEGNYKPLTNPKEEYNVLNNKEIQLAYDEALKNGNTSFVAPDPENPGSNKVFNLQPDFVKGYQDAIKNGDSEFEITSEDGTVQKYIINEKGQVRNAVRLKDNKDGENKNKPKKQNNNQSKNNQENQYTTNYTEMSNLSVMGDGPGKANILENGRPITAEIAGGMVKVDGVKVSGTDIIIDSSAGDMNFGRFKLENGKYKWYPEQKKKFTKTPMQWFRNSATEAQKKAFDKFINAIETDKKYADALMKHIQGGEGGINAGTLQNIT